MQIQINGDLIDVLIVYKNNKNIYLRFNDEGKLIATCNRFVREKDILNLIQKNQEKIMKMYQSIKKVQNEEKFFLYLGKKYTIVYSESIKAPIFDGDLIFVKNKKMLDSFYKKETERIFTSELNRILPYFKNIPKFTLKFRNMKTRWGVNNRSSNTITLNTELLKKDLDLLDYVIIHELCHFYEPNHSNRFWNHVEQYYPKYKEARKRLRS